MHGPLCCNSLGTDSISRYRGGSYQISVSIKLISSSLILWHTVPDSSCWNTWDWLNWQRWDPQSLPPSQTPAKPRRESCEADKFASLLRVSVWLRVASSTFFFFFYLFIYFFPRSWQHFSSATVFAGFQNILFPCCNAKYVIGGPHCLQQKRRVLKIQRKRKRKALMMLFFVSSILNNSIKSLWFVIKWIQPWLRIQCGWNT